MIDQKKKIDYENTIYLRKITDAEADRGFSFINRKEYLQSLNCRNRMEDFKQIDSENKVYITL